jgi:uncharacterized protein
MDTGDEARFQAIDLLERIFWLPVRSSLLPPCENAQLCIQYSGERVMLYEWDDTKAQSNLQKHGVDFADAVAVFSDPAALTVEDDFPDEPRFVTLGMDAFGTLLVVIYTWREEGTIRIISARKATRAERRRYEEDT